MRSLRKDLIGYSSQDRDLFKNQDIPTAEGYDGLLLRQEAAELT